MELTRATHVVSPTAGLIPPSPAPAALTLGRRSREPTKGPADYQIVLDQIVLDQILLDQIVLDQIVLDQIVSDQIVLEKTATSSSASRRLCRSD